MIFGNLNQAQRYAFLLEKVKAFFKHVKEHDLLSYEEGSYKINGDEFFVNVNEYDTVLCEDCFWEVYKKYIDVHVMLKGQEFIDVNFIDDNMQLGEYKADNDFQALDGDYKASVKLNLGDFPICYPEDAHRTGVIADKACHLKKAIFKIKVED